MSIKTSKRGFKPRQVKRDQIPRVSNRKNLNHFGKPDVKKKISREMRFQKVQKGTYHKDFRKKRNLSNREKNDVDKITSKWGGKKPEKSQRHMDHIKFMPQLEYKNFKDITNKALEKKSDLKINIEENSVDDNVNDTDVVQKFYMVSCYFGMSSDSDEF